MTARVDPVRWGVVSTARIGLQKVLPAMQQSPWVSLRAIASRSEGAARAAAERLGIPVAYGSYEALLADPEIEAVYVPLPNHLHVPVALAAAEAGKHVLCEKPIALTADEAERLRGAAGRVLIMEAFMVRFHPQWLRVRELLAEGRIGTPRAVQVLFAFHNVDPGNIRNQPEVGGGALYDIGCYAVVAGRFAFGAEPRRAVALVDRDPALRVDRTVSGLVDFGEGRQLAFTVSTQCAPWQRVQLCGSQGRIEIAIPFNAPAGEATRIALDDGSLPGGGAAVVETIPPCDQYTLQGEAFSRAVRGAAPLPYGVDDAVANMRVIDALFRSERSGRWEEIG